MKRAAREFGFVVLSWLVPFVAAVCIFSLKESNTPLFDSLMGVILTTSTVALAVLYFRRVTSHHAAVGARIGLTWMVANWLLDGAMFSGGPMKMTFDQYASDIGVAYLAIPAITIGFGIVASRAAR